MRVRCDSAYLYHAYATPVQERLPTLIRTHRRIPHLWPGFYSSWCAIMPVVRAAAYLYELSSKRLKWSVPYPPSLISLRLANSIRQSDDISTVSILPGYRSIQPTCDELSRSVSPAPLSFNDSELLDNDRSVHCTVISRLSLNYFRTLRFIDGNLRVSRVSPLPCT